jgi:hypothetical protein
MKISWPDNRKFAFTIIDDTDNSTIQNTQPVYKMLEELGFKTTKSVWVYPPRDTFKGATIQDLEYQKFILDLQGKGFEIALHNVGSGNFNREEIIQGLELYKQIIGTYPNMHINHSQNKDNLYWGSKRFGYLLSVLHKLYHGKESRFQGEIEGAPSFWGDKCKEHIQYVRNRVFNDINTLSCDSYMPYKESNKTYVNNWFSASDGHTIDEFLTLISKRNVDKLEREGGLCIVYTHFASGFVSADGKVDPQFYSQMKYLSEKKGWFVPASTALDYLNKNKQTTYLRSMQSLRMDFIWLMHRLQKRIKFKR